MEMACRERLPGILSVELYFYPIGLISGYGFPEYLFLRGDIELFAIHERIGMI